MKTLTIDNVDFSLPSSMNEMSTGQLMSLTYFLQKDTNPEELKVKMLLVCLDANLYRKQGEINGEDLYVLVANKKQFPLTAIQFAGCTDAFDFLFSAPDKFGRRYIQSTLTINPFKVCQAGCRTIYGVADVMSDVLFGQFVMMQTYQTKLENADSINQFLSYFFYLSKNNTETISSEQIHYIKKLSPSVKTITMWYYEGCLKFFEQKYKLVFSGNQAGENTDVFDSYLSLTEELSKGEVVEREKLRNTLIHDVFDSLERKLNKK